VPVRMLEAFDVLEWIKNHWQCLSVHPSFHVTDCPSVI